MLDTTVSARRLAAVMFADIVGYTAMMQDNESDARGVCHRFRAVLQEVLPSHAGEIVQFYGDGALVIFESAKEAATQQAEQAAELARLKEAEAAREREEAEKRAAEEQAKREAEVAEQARKEERQRIMDEAPTPIRRPPKAHGDGKTMELKAAVNRAIVASLLNLGLDDEQARKVVVAMATGNIPSVSINYQEQA